MYKVGLIQDEKDPRVDGFVVVYKFLKDKYNEDMKSEGNEEAVISYTDLVGVLMSSVTSIVNVISYVL